MRVDLVSQWPVFRVWTRRILKMTENEKSEESKLEQEEKKGEDILGFQKFKKKIEFQIWKICSIFIHIFDFEKPIIEHHLHTPIQH